MVLTLRNIDCFTIKSCCHVFVIGTDGGVLCTLALILCVIWMQEFNRLRSSLRAKKEHASLLEDFREFDRTRLDIEDGGGSYEQALLKEHAAVSRSTGQVTWKKVYLLLLLRNLLFCRMYGSFL